jgi:hypothetical protein
MPRLSLGLGVQSLRKIKAGAAPAPPGLPAQIIVSGAGVANGTYTRTTSAGAYTPEPISGTYNYLLAPGIFYMTSPGNTNRNEDYPGNDWVLASGNDSAYIFSENTSTDANNVPTSGWSPSITITAA